MLVAQFAPKYSLHFHVTFTFFFLNEFTIAGTNHTWHCSWTTVLMVSTALRCGPKSCSLNCNRSVHLSHPSLCTNSRFPSFSSVSATSSTAALSPSSWLLCCQNRHQVFLLLWGVFENPQQLHLHRSHKVTRISTSNCPAAIRWPR
jgi:hypothetical protein